MVVETTIVVTVDTVVVGGRPVVVFVLMFFVDVWLFVVTYCVRHTAEQTKKSNLSDSDRKGWC